MDKQNASDAEDLLKKYGDDPEFCRLLGDYAKEISDPKVKAEQDAYLAQLEAEGQTEAVYGKGVQLIVPKPGFVIKTKTADGTTRVYINVCTSPKVGKMAIKQSSDPLRPGRDFSVPCLLNQQSKAGAAADNKPFKTFDYIVHPEALATCVANLQLSEMLVSMAIEHVEVTTRVRLLRKFKLPGLKYKGANGEQAPSVVSVRTADGADVVDGHLRPLSQPTVGTAPVTAAANMRHAAAAVNGQADSQESSSRGSRSKFSFGSSASRQNARGIQQPSQKAAARVTQAPTTPRPITPPYKVIERARVDLGQAWGDTGRTLQACTNIPEALTVRIDVPGVTSATSMQLDVTNDAVRLEVPDKYLLVLQLKYRVDFQQGGAKFNTAKQQLVLTLPVVQALEQQQHHDQDQLNKHQQQSKQQKWTAGCQEASASDVQGQTQHDKVTEAHTSGQQLPDNACCTLEPVQQGQHQDGACQAAINQAESELHTDVQDTVAASSQSACTAAPSKTANQLHWDELHKKLDEEAQAQTARQQCTTREQQQDQPTSKQRHNPAPLLRPRLSSSRVCAADFF